jgi:Aspartyl protease
MRKVVMILGAAIVLVVLSMGTALASVRTSDHVRVEPIVKFALPSTQAGCGGAVTLGGGAQKIPIRVSTVAGQVGEVVNICISGMGPFPFLIDTGSGQTGIDTRLAARLHLADLGSPSEFDGIGCTGSYQDVEVTTWSMDGVALAPQALDATIQPGLGEAGEPVGLLGSDVLNRFGAVRLDFKAQTLTVEANEGPNTAAVGATVRGPVGPVPSAALTHGQKGITVPVTVELTPGNVGVIVPLRFGKGPARDFAVDTGSSVSDVDTGVAASAHLEHSDLAQRQQSACSVVTAPLVHSGLWSVPGLTLHPQLIDTQSFGSISAGGIVGTLGSDQLQRFGWVIFDYRGGRLILG